MENMRKIIMILLVVVVIVVSFAACDIAHEHTWVDATCTAPKTCSVCKATEGTPLQHKYSNNECEYCGSQDPAYTELLLGASIYSDLLDSAADIESVGNYISRAWYFAIYEADGISLGSDGIKEFAEFIEADEEFVDEVVTEYLITVGYSQNQITAAIKADALNSIDYAVEIAMWLCEDAGLTNEIESNLQKVKSSLKSMTNEYDDVTGLSELKEMYIKVENYYEFVTTAECSYKEFNAEIDKYTDEILKIIDHLDFIYE